MLASALVKTWCFGGLCVFVRACLDETHKIKQAPSVMNEWKHSIALEGDWCTLVVRGGIVVPVDLEVFEPLLGLIEVMHGPFAGVL